MKKNMKKNMKKKTKANYRFIPINVFFPPQKTTMKDNWSSTTSRISSSIPHLVWKNEYEIKCRFWESEQEDQKYQFHFCVQPLWFYLGLEDKENLESHIDSDGWIGVHVPKGRHFSSPKHITSLKTFLHALSHLFQNQHTYLCMDTMTGSLSLCYEGYTDEDIEDIKDIENIQGDHGERELNIYRLRVVR
jgi:hypothetical protein